MQSKSLGSWVRCLAGSLLAIHLGAQAGAGSLSVVVSPISPSVSASSNPDNPDVMVSSFGYTVSVTNTGRNTINDIRFLGTASPTGQASAVVDGATCQTTASTVNCLLGQLASRASYPTFTVFFQAPLTAGDAVFEGFIQYAEGQGGEPTSTPRNSIKAWEPSTVVITDVDDFAVESVALKTGGRFFTGNGTASALDAFVTAVKLPAHGTFSLVSIDESTLKKGCINFKVCYETDLSIPGRVFGENIEVELLQDASNIKAGSKVDKVKVLYLADNATQYQEVLPCPSPLTARNGTPCIAERSESAAGFRWLLYNDRNGSYRLP